jgi:hypothetical protein
MTAIQQLEIRTDWFEEICQRLDALRLNAHKYADKDEILPPDKLYDVVKDNIQNLRQLAGFPTLTTPDVWLGPGGEIGVTWDAGDRSFDLVFGKRRLTARLTDGTQQQLVEPKDVPTVLTQFAA